MTIPFNGSILRAEESTDDMYKSIDGVVDKLIRQFRKQKANFKIVLTGMKQFVLKILRIMMRIIRKNLKLLEPRNLL